MTINAYAINWDDIRRSLLAFDRPLPRSVKLRPPGQPWFHAKPGDDPGDETRADGFTEFHFDDTHRALVEQKWLLRDCEWFKTEALTPEELKRWELTRKNYRAMFKIGQDTQFIAELCPVCGVAWGMDCGRTNCGLSEKAE